MDLSGAGWDSSNLANLPNAENIQEYKINIPVLCAFRGIEENYIENYLEPFSEA